MEKGAQTQHYHQYLVHFSPELKAAKFVLCIGGSHGKCYSDHSFDYNGATQNMRSGSVLRRTEELFFTNKQNVQGSNNSHPNCISFQSLLPG